MITARTKRQLLIFVIITLVGVTFVGARYARLDRLFLTTDYQVTAKFVDSGGAFTGAEVTYRGHKVGQVSDMKLTRAGVDVILSIDKGVEVPSDTIAQVGNKSAVGEQYVDLQPKRDGGPYLKNGSTIPTADTEIPISTTELLTSVDDLVNSVPQGDLRTVVGELGEAFEGKGRDLGTLIDSSSSFLQTADRNFEVTAALIRDANTVLGTQADKASAIRNFSTNLALFSGTLAGSDPDLRRLIDNGAATADQLRTFLEQNRVNLGQLISNLVTTGEVVVKHLDGVQQILVLYPYLIEGSYSVLAKSSTADCSQRLNKSVGCYNARFGLVLQQNGPVCEAGYLKNRRSPHRPDRLEDPPLPENIRCTDGSKTFRGAARAPNRAPVAYRAPATYDAPVVATYDQGTGKVTWTDHDPSADVTYTGGAKDVLGAKDSWTWMLLSPVADAD